MTETCTIPDCGKPVIARGWCEGHYRRWRRHGSPVGGRHVRTGCRVEECTEPHDSHGLCAVHRERWRRHGDPEWVPLVEVDEIAVERAIRGDRPDHLTTGEREEVVKRLHRLNFSDGRIAEHLDVGATAVQQIRSRTGLPAVPVDVMTRRAAA